jgi:metal-dependent amidase/aminoacylase/carboxypeptidase family protein
MITLLAPMGAKYNLQFVPEYGADGSVSVAVIYSPKGDEDAVPKTLSFSGTIAEVEEALTKDLPAAVEKLVKHRASIEALDAELAAEVEAKKKEVEKDKANAKAVEASKVKAKAEAAAKAKGKSQPLSSVASPEVPVEAPPAPPPEAPAGLQPAWKQAAKPKEEKPEVLDWSSLTGEG